MKTLKFKLYQHQRNRYLQRMLNTAGKLAHQLTHQFDVLCFETLNLKVMQRVWEHKGSNLTFQEFLPILRWVAMLAMRMRLSRSTWLRASAIGLGDVRQALLAVAA